MDLINHQSNGINGLRIAATSCVVIGWVALVVGTIGGLVSDDVIFIAPFGIGVITLAVMYLIACIIRGFATIVESNQANLDRIAEAEEAEYQQPYYQAQ